jgi:PAS domain S-box-containing protein
MAESQKRDYPKLIGRLLFFAYILFIAYLAVVDVNVVFEPPLLLPITNTLFTAIIPLVVALVAARVFLKSGSFSIFLMGCGMLSFGISAAFAGWLIRAQDGTNINVTIYNSGALLGSLFHIVGAALGSLDGLPRWKQGLEKAAVVSAYGGITLLVILFTLATLQHVVPPFFIQGSGPTALRQLVLGLSIFFYALSALVFMHQYLKMKWDFLYWYTLCLSMLALGLFAFYVQHAVGSPIGWAGRTANYMGAIFAAVAVGSAVQRAKSKGLALEDAISSFFMDVEGSFRSLVETASVAIVSYDQGNRIILWNSSAERMFGYSKAEAIGSSFEQIVPREYAADLGELIAGNEASLSVKPDSTRTIEVNARNKVGDLLPVEISAFSRKIMSGSVITCLMRNIAERKRAEQAVRDGEERLRFALESSHTGAWDLDLVDHSAFRSLEYDRIFGYAELLPQWTYEMFLDHVLTEDRDEVDATFRHATETQGNWSFECRIRRTDGEVRWIWAAGCHRADATGAMRRMAGIVQDITDRKQAEEALRKAKEELEERVKERTYELYEESLYARSLIEASLDPLVTISVDGKITDVNHASTEVTGVPRAQLIGSDFSDYFTEPEKARAGYEEVFRRGFVRDYPLELKHRGGQVTPVLYNASVYRDDRGRIMGIFAAARDITERKKAEAALRRLASELVMAEERERKRIAGVLHDEVAQTLAAAKMRIDMLQSIPLDQEDRQALKEAKGLLLQSIQETRALMHDIGNPLLSDLGLQAACESLAKRLMEKHPVRISCDIQDTYKHLNPDVKSILFQMFRELLTNIVKYSKAQNAHIRIGMENGHFRLRVADDGVGFDPQMLGAPTVAGGFGLYSIRERLIAVNGSLRIESAPGAGTVVTATLPVALD